MHSHVPARRVIGALVVTLGAAVFETAISAHAGSYFLFADAIHLVAHLGIFVVLLLPTHGPRHDTREDLATLVVLAIVVVIATGLGVHTVIGLLAQAPPPHPLALLASLAGLAANLTSAWLFRDPAEHRSSFRAAFTHELSDASLTIVGLVGAGAIALFHFAWVDPALSLAITGWLAFWAIRLVVRRIRFGRAAWETADLG